MNRVGFAAAGQKEHARKASARAIQLAPTDATLDAGARASLVADSTHELQALKP